MYSGKGILPPFNTQTEDIRAMARHCSVGIELRMAAERIILVDTQASWLFTFPFLVSVYPTMLGRVNIDI